jgi:hypothetical protein
MKSGTWNVQGCRNKMEEILSEINKIKNGRGSLNRNKEKGNRK